MKNHHEAKIKDEHDNKTKEHHGTRTPVRSVSVGEPLACSKPTTTAAPDHANATANIYISGLSILCVEQDAVRIGFVESGHSPVGITVFHGSSRPYWSYRCPAGQRMRIEIEKTNPNGVGEFYVDGKASPEDYLWMPDLESTDWHASPVNIKPDAMSNLSAVLVLKDATFYTRWRSVTYAIQRAYNGSIRRLPTLGRVLGADIICAPTDDEIVIKVIDRDDTVHSEFSTKLPADGTPYVINVETRALDDSYDHLHMLYDDIVDTWGGRRFEMRYTNPEPEWRYCGFIGDTSTRWYYENGTPDADNVSDHLRRAFNTEEDATLAGYTPGGDGRATEYACQPYGGGCGPLPSFP